MVVKKLAIMGLTDTLYPRMWTINSYLLHSVKAQKNLMLSQTSLLCIFHREPERCIGKVNNENKKYVCNLCSCVFLSPFERVFESERKRFALSDAP